LVSYHQVYGAKDRHNPGIELGIDLLYPIVGKLARFVVTVGLIAESVSVN